MVSLQEQLELLVQGEDLSIPAAYAAFSAIMQGEANEIEMAALLTALRVKGESVAEIVGAARAMQEQATPIVVERRGLLDTCGTGGDRLGTFNISTAAAFVLAACDVPIAKHGNRSVSSNSGSADVLEALGVNINLTPQNVARCIDELGIGFCFAPLFHSAMKHAAPVRKQLKFRTIFNLLGPLTNPARAEFQLLGTGRVETAARLARALSELGRERALVVSGADHLDEVSLWGVTQAFEVTPSRLIEHRWTAASFGLPEVEVGQLKVASAAESAAVLRRIYAGERGAPRDIVLANVAAGLLVFGKVADLQEGVSLGAEAIDSGRAENVLSRLVGKTQEMGK
jgi:anthranilate phosphoribosyltransferase